MKGHILLTSAFPDSTPVPPGQSPETAKSPPAVEMQDVYYTHPDGRIALHDLNLRIPQGERTALLGPNGAGKTTLALHCNGVLRPQAGIVTVFGRRLTPRNARSVRQEVGIVFQDPDDQLFLPTVAQDTAFGPANLGLRGKEQEERVAQALAAVALSHLADRPPHHLSMGEKRRAALAGVLAMRPRLLVLDEPTANLDPRARRLLADFLRDQTITQLIITHDLPFALDLCPAAILLSAGSVVAHAPTSSLLQDAALLAQHGLELPYGLDPALLQPPPA